MNPSSLLQTLHGIGADYSLQLTRALLHFLWLGVVIAIAYAVAACGLGRARAGVRYVAGVAALLLMVACLPATLFVLSSPQSAAVKTVEQPGAASMPPGTAGESATDIVYEEISIQQFAADHAANLLAWASPYASGLYLCGVVLMLLRVALGLWGGRRLLQSCTLLSDGPIVDMLRDHARRMALGVIPAVAYCQRISVPIVVGVLRPMILLPASLASSLTLEQLELVLLHELAHIRRYDPAVNLLQRLVEALLFFHPAVWWLSRRISFERENACDDQVLRWNHGRVPYADALLRVAELCAAIHNRPALPNASMAATGEDAGQLKRRVLRLLEINEDRRFRLTSFGMAASILVGVSLLLMALAGGNVAQAEPESRAETTARPIDSSGHEQAGDATSGQAVERPVRPTLKAVMFVGCQGIRKKVLQEVANLKAGDAADTAAIENTRGNLETYYHTHGFARARIRLLEGDKPEDRRAIFLINEGTRQEVWNTAFTGNTIVSDDRLRAEIDTGRLIRDVFGGAFDRKKADNDRCKLTAYYRGIGCFRVRIGRELEFNEKGDGFTVTYVINEGPRFKIRNVSVVGNTKYPSEQLLTNLKVKSGDYFNQSATAADLSKIHDTYVGNGYAFVDVKADPRFLEESDRLDLVYQVKEDAKAQSMLRPSVPATTTEPAHRGTSDICLIASPQATPAAVVPVGDGSRIIARVGPDVILESDVAGAVNEVIERKKDRIAPDQLESQRKILAQKRLECLIETKLILQDARHAIPAEGWSHVQTQLTKHFEELELEKMMKKAGASTPRELDQKLRAMGTSLEREKRAFSERVLAQQWLHQQIKSDEVAASKPLRETRDDIPKETIQERSQRQLREYMAKLEARTPVWTIFDDDAPKTQVTPPLQR